MHQLQPTLQIRENKQMDSTILFVISIITTIAVVYTTAHYARKKKWIPTKQQIILTHESYGSDTLVLLIGILAITMIIAFAGKWAGIW